MAVQPRSTRIPGGNSGASIPRCSGTSRPPAGWAEAEAARIAALAQPYVWVLGIHWSDHELPALRAALYARGLRPVETVQEPGALAQRLRAGPPPPAGISAPGAVGGSGRP